MTGEYRILPRALEDLDDHMVYLATVAGAATAWRFEDAADRTFARLARMPGLGERHDSSRPQLAELRIGRVEGFDNHLAFYRPIEGGIEVVRVLHGARDIDRALEEA